MSQIGVSVVMAVSFRLVQQEFSNVFYYKRPLIGTSTSEQEAIIDEIVGKMKPWHSVDVTFKRANLWSAGGTQAENNMLFQKNLSGVGSAPASTSLDRERAYLIRWPAGKDIKGRPVYLRKWFHTCGSFGAIFTPTSAQMQNTAPIDDANRTNIANAVNSLKVVGATVDTWTICGPKGRDVTGDAQCHKYLEHHQLGDMWR